MQLSSSDHGTESVLTVSGDVKAADVPELRIRILDLLNRNVGDVLLDMRRAARLDDLLITALTASRSRAKFLRHRLVVVAGDEDEDEIFHTLRRLGLLLRIPVFADLDRATVGLAADRAARDRLTLVSAPTDALPDLRLRSR
jgi:anti-anti-sigma regulatory factor